MRVEITAEDCDEIRCVLAGHVADPLPDDAVIRERLLVRPEIVGLALAWDWDDTEVRDELCQLFGSTA